MRAQVQKMHANSSLTHLKHATRALVGHSTLAQPMQETVSGKAYIYQVLLEHLAHQTPDLIVHALQASQGFYNEFKDPSLPGILGLCGYIGAL